MLSVKGKEMVDPLICMDQGSYIERARRHICAEQDISLMSRDLDVHL